MQNIAKKKKKDFSGSKFEVSCQHAPNNLRFKKAQQLTVSNAFLPQDFIHTRIMIQLEIRSSWQRCNRFRHIM
jgi:hypothetical protein